tara:strand:+ start:34 stop:1104 length:1071 start_codon:yes stop_codon:yes gene_type:complete
MAKTIQEQYNQIKKGTGNKEIFLKEVKRNYPNMIVNSATFEQAEEILLQRSVLSENIHGMVSHSTKKPDWFKIFDDNMNVIKEETEAAKKDEAIKAEVNKPNKDVVELETKGFDYKDKDNIDNLNGEQVRLGVKFEMDKVRETVSDAELGEAIKKAQDTVVKNLSKDPLHYVKNAAFGVDGIGYTDEAPGLTASKSDQMEPVKLNEGISLMSILENGPLGEKPKAKRKIKKETIDTKLAEIDRQSQIVAMEAKINAISEVIASKSARINLVNEDNDLAELLDKAKIKAIQKEVKILEKRKAKMEKLYEKMCGKRYKQPVEEESNAGSNEGSNDNSNYNSNENPESYSGLKKYRENN